MSADHPLVLERTYAAPLQKVWNAISDRRQMRNWYFDIPDFNLAPGAQFSFSAGADGKNYLHLCEIAQVIPQQTLSYTWKYDGYPGESLVTFELEQLSPEQTRLKLTHQGLHSFPEQEEDFAPANFELGWSYMLNDSLKDYLEAPSIREQLHIDAPRRKVWQILLNLNETWAAAFGNGTIVEAAWEINSSVAWKDGDGNRVAFGLIEELTREEVLAIRYYDETHPGPDTLPGSYMEQYRLTDLPGGQTEIRITVGPLEEQVIDEHRPMWDEALRAIKNYAEA